MALKTATLGAFPKPDYVPIIDWFRQPDGPDGADPTGHYVENLAALGDQAETLFARGTADIIADQVAAGIDIVTDGEVRRENYIHYHCRHLDGVDFNRLTETELRGGNYSARLPTITGPVRAGAAFLRHDWRVAQAFTERPVKVTVPGPMTIGDTLADRHYGDPRRRGAALAAALNAEILALAEAGCRYIQIDEPVFARKVADALAFGFEDIERCFHGLPEAVERTVHMCCGYPDRLDNPAYPKADRGAYIDLAPVIEASSIQAVSIEDAHRHNDLRLLEMFAETKVLLGVVAVAKSRIEPVDEIRQRLHDALLHIDAERLIAAPDCGLGLLSRGDAVAKLTNLAEAAHCLP